MNESLRAEYWLKCWVAVANSNNCTSSSVCTSFADVMLKDYDKRFKTDPENYKKTEKEEGILT